MSFLTLVPSGVPEGTMAIKAPELQAALESLLLQVKQDRENEENAPTLRELWGRVDGRPNYERLQSGYWEIAASKVSSGSRLDLSWRTLCKFEVRGIPLENTKALDVTDRWVEDLRKLMHQRVTVRKKPVRNASVNRDLEMLSRMLRWAHKNGRIPYNPLPVLTREDESDGIPKTKLRYEWDFQKLLDACEDNLMLRAMILVLYDGGLRRGEVFNLRRDQIVRKISGGAIIELGGAETKNGDPRRPPITKRALEALDLLPEYGQYYFCKPDGERYHKRYLYELYVRAVRRSGLKGVNGESINIHTLRHSCMYVSRARGVPWVVQKRRQGWKTDSAPQRYGQPDDEEVDHWMEVVESGIAKDQAARHPHKAQSVDMPDNVSKSPQEKAKIG